MKLESYTARKTDLDGQNFINTYQKCKGTVEKINKNSKKYNQELSEKVFKF